MDWVFNHLQLIIAIAGAIGWWLSQRKQVRAGDEAPPPEQRGFEDPELAERTRRIREEIQRKIEQRAKGYATEQPRLPRAETAEPPPVVREVVITRAAPEMRRGMSQAEAQQQTEILAQQATLADKLREAELMKAAALKRTEFEAATADHSVAARTLSRSTVLDDLRDPAALRRAFILREVLGPPVALR
ncbi:hypothetical protein [Opitutus sp. GAS368]|jgi:hypothetical protein|uniref:hypothetical protein n=1 Tax=Opitutus sp. GAS368 TaxID=1882749 RepID=UPI00087C306F|nr:hypothetical protein [Opitutus sp. GAS368]SDS29392.1 hypothetical protein SAMN05444173_2455 [Opitutus sp. GAS368]